MITVAWLFEWAAAARSALRTRFRAKKAASQLLREILSPAQRFQYSSQGYFDVIGGHTGKRYRIRRGSQMNVEELDATGQRTRVLCFVPTGGLPVGDILVAQKLALEVMEKDTLEVARTSGWLGHN